MKSMTGFGHGQTDTAQSHIEISVRAINGRFFEPRFHLPRELLHVESDLKKILQNHFSRGTVDVFVVRKVKWQSVQSQIVVNKKLVDEYHRALQGLAKILRGKYDPQVEMLARFPDVLRVESNDMVSAQEAKAVLKAMDHACKACSQEKKREGSSIRHDLDRLLKDLEAQVKVIGEIREEVNQQIHAKMEQKLKSKLSAVEGAAHLDPVRLSQEVLFVLEKSDINEELVRLREHIKNYRHLLGQDEPLGKKLDFYTQELLREVNTIGSKSSVSRLTQIVVEAKTIIERLREQVQNVE